MLLVSQGVPMLLMGDEVGRTQQGNNNAYCHDSPLTWLDWRLQERERRAVPLLPATDRRFAQRHPALRQARHCQSGSSAGDALRGHLARHAGLAAGLGARTAGCWRACYAALQQRDRTCCTSR